jgi:hypothetical protein
VLEEEEQGEDLPECMEHHPSLFERGKPRSIISLILYKSKPLYIRVLYVVALSYRSWGETVDAFITILAYLITFLPC